MVILAVLAVSGCRSAQEHREKADLAATKIIAEGQQDALNKTEPFTIETPTQTLRRRLLKSQHLPRSSEISLGSDQLDEIKYWPKDNYLHRPRKPVDLLGKETENHTIQLTLVDALQIGARNNRDYQSTKENVFQAALDLELQRDAFRNTFSGLIDQIFSHQIRPEQIGAVATGTAEHSRTFENGLNITSRIIIDLATLLSGDRETSTGLLADISASIPLLAGSGEHIVREPLTQAERNVLYELWRFERFKRTFAVQVASDYLQVLQNLDQVNNARINYERLQKLTKRSVALSEAGRLPKIDLGESLQDELNARDRWIRAKRTYDQSLDRFKITLGLPTDAQIDLDQSELKRLTESSRQVLGAQDKTDLLKDLPMNEYLARRWESAKPGPMEINSRRAVELSLKHRMDLRVTLNTVEDAQRSVVIAADALRPGLNLTASGSTGERRSSVSSAQSDTARFEGTNTSYSLGLELDLPWEKTAEQIAYRNSLIRLEKAVRNVQDQEDQIKLAVRDGLRKLAQARASYIIQSEALKVAQQRATATALLLQAGRATIRDQLFAENSLITAKNALIDALVSYRITELEVQRDMGVLQVNEKGLWREFEPK